MLLLTGAALGDRFGRRRMFAIGLGIFTPPPPRRRSRRRSARSIAARAVQGLGGAIVMPLTLTILSAAFPPSGAASALGAWGGICGLAVALGPLVGGAVVDGISWHWIFWLNVPIGLVLAPLALAPRSQETHGPARQLDLPGSRSRAPACSGSSGASCAATASAGRSPEIVGALVGGAAVLAAFVCVGAPRGDADAADALLPQPDVRARERLGLFMFFGMFGSIFLLAQFFQTVQGYSPLQSGLRILPWTAMPMFVAPIAGALSDRIGGRPLMALGLALQAIGLAWIAAVSTPTTPYSSLVVPFALAGTGMALFFAPVANVVLSSVRAGGGGPGVGRQQRDPRARRRPRRRGARLGLRARRRLPQRAGVRRRHDAGRLRRRRRRRARRARGVRDRASPGGGPRAGAGGLTQTAVCRGLTPGRGRSLRGAFVSAARGGSHPFAGVRRRRHGSLRRSSGGALRGSAPGDQRGREGADPDE